MAIINNNQAPSTASSPLPALPTPPATLASSLSLDSVATVTAQLEHSKQMLNVLGQLQSSWLGPNHLASLGAPLSSSFVGLTGNTVGQASNLESLQTNLRGMYAGALPGMTDDLTRISPPLSSAYAQMMATPGGLPGTNVPGMPVARPLALGETSSVEGMLASLPPELRTPPIPTTVPPKKK